MIFGFNTDVQGRDAVYHVQTEDRGARHPVIESIIYVGGKIIDRRRKPYIPAEVTPEELNELVRRQHKRLVESIREGAFVASQAESAVPSVSSGYAIRLENLRILRRDGQLSVELFVGNGTAGSPAPGVSLDLRWTPAGGDTEARVLQTRQDGKAAVSLYCADWVREGILLASWDAPGGRQLAKFRLYRREEGCA